MNGFVETGSQDRIWIQRNRIFSGKARVDHVHVWSYRDRRIWIQWDMFFSGKLKLDGFIGTRNGCK